MTQTLTSQQALLIARTLDRLDTMSSEADQMFLKIELRDPQFDQDSPDAVIGTFTEEEGTWLFSFTDHRLTSLMRATEPWTPTLEEYALSVYKTNPVHYTDRKITFIKDTRKGWETVMGTAPSLVDTKNACEAVLHQKALDDLRDKLTAGDDYQYDIAVGDSEERAYAEHRERMAERGTWFGVPGPMDEEPPF